ncbi:MAG: FMN-binding glutamate synthase family protein, partial [Myxococcota bacterium]
VTNNNEERPFNRDQRRWVYASAKKQNNYFGFGTDNDLELSPNHIVIRHSPFPLADPHPGDAGYDSNHTIASEKVLGESRDRPKSFRPSSVVNISAMSFGSLSGNAIAALNKGCKLADCLHNTGEGGVSIHHQHGGELIWQLGTGYFGCRAADGGFDEEAFLRVVEANPVRAIEVKLSQGAKPGVGGLLPAVKITPEISEARGIPMGEDCASPAHHREFGNIRDMLGFVERLASASGLPVGIKSAVGQRAFWNELAEEMKSTGQAVDFIAVDGGEGGTGAAPLVFSDHVALPFKQGFAEVFHAFASRGLDERVLFFGSGKLGFPEQAITAFCLGCDGVSVGREAMLAIGCIQAQLCHNNRCPTGVATQSPWLARGLDPADKSVRLANYVVTLRKEILRVTRACGH